VRVDRDDRPANGHRRWPAALPAMVLVLLAAAALAAFLVSRATVENQKTRILAERTSEAALLTETSIGDVGESLRPLGVAARLGRASTEPFLAEARAQSAAAGDAAAARTVALVRQTGNGLVVTAAEGPRLAAGDVLSGARAAAVQRALASPELASTGIFPPGAGGLLGFAAGPPMTLPGSAVYLEFPIDPRAAVPVTDERPFHDLDAAIYASEREDPDQLVVATADVPFDGRVARESVVVGGERWLLVATPREPLVGSFAESVPWIILAVGLLGAGVAGAVALLLLRRRDYALALADLRTVELRRSLQDLEETQARLVFQERLATIGQVAAAVGHELRNPLGVLTNALFLVRTALSAEDQQRLARHLDIADREIAASVVIVETLLDFARERDPVLEPVDVADLVDESLSVAPPPRGVAVERAGVDEAPTISADRQQLRQVLLNLLTNAYEAMDGDGELTITARPHGHAVELSVADTGEGMDDETAEHVFDPFFTRKAKGIGLGLAVSKRIAEAHGGTLAADTEPGRGTTFTLTVPTADLREEAHV
jgi:signal transduction histidine kinase